ncbi:hypothetical protein [Aliterella atlantica]|uniref:Uncharacterized protein n=1 Tax=Aliterella atlantica CENA595 TaxID=1618023 RepID=A0A0D8ZP88_9CYAN|nr:hypothetical protein [Aliterella atlantica]KJH70555.1 hypothetical protein UH38_17455 [Aliterella atlantica CENA595]
MFVDELTPIFKEFAQHPVSFLGGLCSGLLRLNLNDDPVKSWIQQQGGSTLPSTSTANQNNNGRSSGPQSISID